jgi:hypothetical protein
MPLERKQFDAEQDTLSLKILDFLQKNKNYAFTAKEVASRLNEDELDVEMALTRLVSPEELLERKRVDGEFYYAIKKAITRFLEKMLY